MSKIKFKYICLLGIMFFSTCFAGDLLKIPDNKSGITENSVDLKASDFFSSYTSSSVSERRFAELYLLGVMDSTEGTKWCGYKKFKTITLRERIYVELKKLNSAQLNQRASELITTVLSQRYPCEKKQ